MSTVSSVRLCKRLLVILLLKAKGSFHWFFSILSRIYKLRAYSKSGLGTHTDEQPINGHDGDDVQLTSAISLSQKPTKEQQVISLAYSMAHPLSIQTSPSHPSNPRSPLSESTLVSQSPLQMIPEACSYIEGTEMTGQICISPKPLTAEPDTLSSICDKSIYCTLPSERPRYDREVVIGIKNISFNFDPIGTFISYKDQSREPWEYNVHPEGQPYYKYKGRFTYLTEADIWNNDTYNDLFHFIREIESRAGRLTHDGTLKVADNKGTIEDNEVEVVLEIDNDWSYYMVDLKRRGIFWLEEYVFGENCSVEERLQLCHTLDYEFWQHIEHFPNRPHDEGILVEVMSFLNYTKIDLLSSADTTSPYNESECSSLLNSLKHLHSLQKFESASKYIVFGYARLMAVIANERRCNFYGFNGARLTATQSVRGDVNKKKNRSWLVRILSPILFYAPETHLEGLEKLWVDGIIKDRRWKSFQEKLERDWEGFVLTSTVLLNANVAILSVPIVISDQNSHSTSAAIASLVSIVVSLGSIIVGLLLVRQIRTSAKNDEYTAHDAMLYLSRREHKQLGLETMAIQYSLPYALLMWGMVSFLASIAIASFQKIHGQPDNLTRGIFGAAWIFVLPLIIWTVVTGWETNQKTHWKSITFMRWWQFSYDTIKSLGRRREDNNKNSNDVESGRSDAGSTLNEDINMGTPGDTQHGKQKRRASWRPRFRVPGPVRRLTSSFPP